jgi:uncharacterized membrane protein YidH (DUF202 family)
MLQSFESTVFIYSIIFLVLGIFAFSWLVVHIEHGRHFSKLKVISALSLGAILVGFGIHLLLVSVGI